MKRYNSYKYSGIEWLGEIPREWKVSKLKFEDEVIMGQSPNSDDVNTVEDGIPFIQGNAEFGIFYPKPTKWCSNPNKLSRENDILLSVRAPVGAINISNQQLGIGRGLCAIRQKTSNYKFIYYYLQVAIKELQSLATGSTFTAVSVDDVKNLPYLKISLHQQETIATFLDRKTLEIDTLVEKKKQLIFLLKEERTAIINHAVTKGINSDVKYKDSGIDWIGEIPEHWEVKKLKYLLKETRDALKSGPFGSHIKNSDYVEDSHYKVYTQRNVLDNDFDKGYENIEQSKYEELKGFSIYEKDILITTRGSIGKCAEFPSHKSVGVLHPCLIRIQVDETKALNEWVINYINNSSLFFNNVKYNSNSTIIDVIYSYTLKEVFFPVPPIGEQQQVIEWQREKLIKLNDIISKTEKEIELMQEYKTALISEVVTGKVDVREEVLDMV